MVQPVLAAGGGVTVAGLRPLAELCSPSCSPVTRSRVINAAFSPPLVSPQSIPVSVSHHLP